jgi:putative ABC transport system permease protein
MNLLKLVGSYLVARPLNSLLNILLLALGLAVITVLILFSRQFEEKISENAKGIDLVVGAKGSPLQIILCSVFHIDFPTGNIALPEAERLARHRLVKKAIPLALGDSYRNFRIVGTTPDYPALYRVQLKEGKWFATDLEVVVGSQVALELGLSLDSTFASAHGLTEEGHAHEENQYRVVGIAQSTGTVMDNLIFTSVPSVWKVHEDHGAEEQAAGAGDESPLVPGALAGDSTREITSLLIQFRNPIAAIQLPRLINGQTNMQAASPAFETARLFSILGIGVDVLRGFAFVLIFMSGLSIFIALYNSLKERQYDLAIMRSMGASRWRLFLSIQAEGLVFTLLGSALGLAMGHTALWAFVEIFPGGQRAGMSPAAFYPQEFWLMAGSWLLGLVCALLPAIQAYRTDIHQILSRS